jgi:hypothetical protein
MNVLLTTTPESGKPLYVSTSLTTGIVLCNTSQYSLARWTYAFNTSVQYTEGALEGVSW